MELDSVRDYVNNRLKVAETYMEHGLIVEGRDVYQQISRNLHNLEKKLNGSDDEFLEWFRTVQDDVGNKIVKLEKEVGAKTELAGAPPWYSTPNKEEENPRTEFLKGIGLKDLGFFDDALECFRRSLNNGYSPRDCLSELLDICKQKEDSRDLALEVRDILDLRDLPEAEKSELWRKLGIYFERAGMRDEALRASEKAKESASPSSDEETGERAEPLKSLESEPASIGGPEEDLPSKRAPKEEEKVATLAVLSDLKNLKMDLDNSAAKGDKQEDEGELSERVIELREEVERLRDELARATELVGEYQKRYTAIMSQTNTLQKENRELKEKLAKTNSKGPRKDGQPGKPGK